MSVHHSKPGALEGRKNVSDSLGPELQKVVSLHAGAGNQNGSSGRVARALKPRHLIPDILSYVSVCAVRTGSTNEKTPAVN